MSRPFHVLVSVPTSSHLSREFARGIARYACVQSDWDTRFLPGREDDFPINELQRKNFDGAIEAYLALPASFHDGTLPIVRLWNVPSKENWTSKNDLNITPDEQSIGKGVANYFINRGFRHFAFAGGLQAGAWSDEREQCFREALRESGYDLEVYQRGHVSKVIRNAKNDEARMCRWLRDLPKPVAILAAYDRRGCQIIRCCQKVGISIPQEVAVVGVDNDSFFCESVHPALSSVRQSMEKTGYEAVAALHEIMKATREKRPFDSNPLSTGFQDVVTRGSSDIFLSPNDTLVSRALSTLSGSETIIQTVHELAEILGVSERLLRLRFSQHNNGKGVHDAIAEERLRRACLLLASTALPIATIAEKTGYSDVSHMDQAFRKSKRTKPSAYRTLFREKE